MNKDANYFLGKSEEAETATQQPVSDRVQDLPSSREYFLAKPYDKDLSNSAAQGFQVSPDVGQRILNVKAETGLPSDFVERNYEELEKQLKQKEFDSKKYAEQSPEFAKWLSENPNNFAAVQHDIENMSYLERQVRHIGQQFQHGRLTVEMSELGGSLMFGDLTPEQEQRLGEIEGELQSAKDYGIDALSLQNVPAAVGNQLPIMAKTFEGKAQGAAVGFGIGATKGAVTALVAGQAGPQAATPEEAITVPAAALTGGLIYGGIGWRWGAAVGAGRLEANLAMVEMRNIRDAQGNPLDKNVQRGGAIMVGLINGTLEMVGLEAVMKHAPGLRQFTRGGLKTVLKNPTMKKAFIQYAKAIGESIGTEGVTEYMQEWVQMLATDLAQMYQDGSLKQLPTETIIARLFSPDKLERATAAGIQGAQAGGGSTVVTSGAGVAYDVHKARKAQATKTAFDNIGKVTQQTEALNKAPKATQEVIKRIVKSGNVDKVYIPVESFRTYWVESGTDPEQAAAEILGDEGVQAYNEAVETGADLEIPMEVYTEKIAPSEHNLFFQDEIKTNPEDLTFRQSEELKKKLDEQDAASQKEGDSKEGETEAPANVRPIEQVDLTAAPEQLVQQIPSVEFQTELETDVKKEQAALLSEVMALQESGAAVDTVLQERLNTLTAGVSKLEKIKEEKLVQKNIQYNDPEFQAKTISKALEQQLVDIGRPKVEANKSAFTAAMGIVIGARQAGVNPIEYFNKKGLKVVAAEVAPEGEQVLGQVDTRSENFQRWFGDSKVVDENGEPLVVYHGTKRNFSQFANSEDITEGGTGVSAGAKALFFTSKSFVAGLYSFVAPTSKRLEFDRLNKEFQSRLGAGEGVTNAKEMQSMKAKLLELEGEIKKEPGFAGRHTFEESSIIPVYLSIKNPRVVDMKNGKLDLRVLDQIITNVKKRGEYDGIIFKNMFDSPVIGDTEQARAAQTSDIYIVFKPTQIKSVFNEGGFDPAKADILKQEAIDRASAIKAEIEENLGKELNLTFMDGGYIREEYITDPEAEVDEYGDSDLLVKNPDSFVDPNITGARAKRAKAAGFDINNTWFHGSRADIKAFSQETLGESTGAGSARIAHFFASSPSLASDYAEASDSALWLRVQRESEVAYNAVNKFKDDMRAKYGNKWVSKMSKEERAQRKSLRDNANKTMQDFWDAQKVFKKHFIGEDYERADKQVKFLKEQIANKQWEKDREAAQKMVELYQSYVDAKAEPIQRESKLIPGKIVSGGWQYRNKETGELLKNPWTNEQRYPDRIYSFYQSPEHWAEGLEKHKKRVKESTEKKYTDALKEAESAQTEMQRFLKMSYEAEDRQTVYPTVLNTSDALVVDFNGAPYREATYREIIERAQQHGYNSVIFQNTYDPAFIGPGQAEPELVDIAAVFSPTQIRSVNAKFKDLSTGDLLFQKQEPQYEDFRWGRYHFDITKAIEKFGNKKPEMIEPTPAMKPPFTYVDKRHAATTDLSKPIIFATIEINGSLASILIDGNHRLEKALTENVKEIPAIILSKDETDSILNTLFQKSKQPQGAFDPATNIIYLFKNANASTFMHEMGHFYLNMITEFVNEGLASEQQVKDFQTIRDFLGVAEGEALTREHHEDWARSFENYLREGKAPSASLRTAFAGFRKWLSKIYKGVQYIGNVKINDDIRGVMDRMLATEEDIQAAQAELNLLPMVSDFMDAGMDEAEAVKHAKAINDARLTAEESLLKQHVEQLEREEKRWYKEERDQVEAEVKAALNDMPEYVALANLQRAKQPDGSDLAEGVPAVKINRKSLEAAYDKEFIKKLPKGITSKEGGLHQDEVASFFGFGSGDEMLQKIKDVNPYKVELKERVDSIMLDTYGDMLMNREESLEVAKDVVHSDKQAELMRKELQILASEKFSTFKKLQQRIARNIPTTAQIRERAEDLINSKKVRDISPIKYQRAEAKAGKLAQELYLKGDFQGAFEAKIKQLMNHELYRAAKLAKEESDKIVNYMRKFERPKVRSWLGKASLNGGNYLEQIDAIMERFSFKKSVSLKAIDRQQSLLQWVNEQRQAGYDVEIDPKLLLEANRQHYKDTVIGELREIRDTVKTIEHLAKLKNQLLRKQDQRTYDEIVDAMVAEIIENNKSVKVDEQGKIVTPPPDYAPDWTKLMKTGGDMFLAAHTKMEFLFEKLAGNKAGGEIWKQMFLPTQKAEDAENTMLRDLKVKMDEIFKEYSRKEIKDWYFNKVYIPEINNSLNKQNMLVVALNQGNAYNKAALLEGNNWTQEQVDAILDRLTEKDWQTVQKLLKLVDSYWPEIKALEESLNGIAPAKVEATPIETKFGTFEGGYYPIIFDAAQSWRVSTREEGQAVQDMFGGNWAKVATKKGHTIERTNTGGQPISLQLSGVTRHLANVIHDLSHREIVIDINKLANDPRIREAIIAAAGAEMYKQIKPWLRAIATDTRNESEGILGKLVSRARNGATVVNMGWKFTTAIVQFTGYSISANDLGAEYARKGLKVFKNPFTIRKAYNDMVKKSAFMRDRMSSMDRDIRDAMKKIRFFDNTKMNDSFFYLIGLMDMAVSMPTWFGAYEKAMDGKADNVEAGNDQAAIEYADRTVRVTQGSGGTKDLAQVQRGGDAMRAFTMFYSYFNVAFNQFQRETNNLIEEKNFPKFLGSMFFLWFVPAVLEDLILGRQPADDADDAEWRKWALEKVAYPTQGIVFVRDLTRAITSDYGYSASAAFDVPKTLAQTGKAGIDYAVGAKDEFKRSDLRNTVMSVGYLSGLPSRQIWLSSEYFYDWYTGEQQPENFVEGTWRGLVVGKPKE